MKIKKGNIICVRHFHISAEKKTDNIKFYYVIKVHKKFFKSAKPKRGDKYITAIDIVEKNTNEVNFHLYNKMPNDKIEFSMLYEKSENIRTYIYENH